jgi:hypothetical protein
MSLWQGVRRTAKLTLRRKYNRYKKFLQAAKDVFYEGGSLPLRAHSPAKLRSLRPTPSAGRFFNAKQFIPL